MNYSLKYETKIDEEGNINWELFSNLPRRLRRCRWASYYGTHSVDEFQKIRNGWEGNLSRDLDAIWSRTEISYDLDRIDENEFKPSWRGE